MAESYSSAKLSTISAPEYPFTIEYSPRTLDDIRSEVVEAFFSVPHGGAEIGGILLGNWDGKRLAITDYAALDCEHAFGPTFTLSKRDQARLTDLLTTHGKNGARPVGWYHSHTRSEILLSDVDEAIHRRFFPETWQVALVLKPQTFQPTKAGFFFRGADGAILTKTSYKEIVLAPLPAKPVPSVAEAETGAEPLRAPAPFASRDRAPEKPPADIAVATFPGDNSFLLEHGGAFLKLPPLEFPVDAAALTERESERVSPGKTAEEAAVPAVALLPQPGSVPSSPSPDTNGKPASASRMASRLWMLAAAIALVAVSFCAAYFIYRPHNQIGNAEVAASTPPEDRAPLRAERQGEDLKIMWDLNSPAVAGATSGILEINDGGVTRQIPLTADQVRFGNLLYTPVSEQISVRLTTLENNQSTKQESVIVVLKRPPQPPPVNGRPLPHIPFEVKTRHMATAHAFVPPAGNRKTKPPVKLQDPPAVQTSSQRVDLRAPLPLGTVSAPPPVTVRPGEPPKPTVQTSPQRVDLPAEAHSGPASPPPAIAVPPSQPAKPREEGYTAAELISQEGVPTPRELRSILTRPVAVTVRVSVNEAGRVTHAEAIAEKGIHGLLLRAAADAAYWCRFQPARRGQSPVASNATIVFHIGPAGKE